MRACLRASGHYVSYVRAGDAWFHCDDATVTRVTASHVLSTSAYLLFYERTTVREIATGPSRKAPAAVSAAARPGSAGWVLGVCG